MYPALIQGCEYAWYLNGQIHSSRVRKKKNPLVVVQLRVGQDFRHVESMRGIRPSVVIVDGEVASVPSIGEPDSSAPKQSVGMYCDILLT